MLHEHVKAFCNCLDMPFSLKFHIGLETSLILDLNLEVPMNLENIGEGRGVIFFHLLKIHTAFYLAFHCILGMGQNKNRFHNHNFCIYKFPSYSPQFRLFLRYADLRLITF